MNDRYRTWLAAAALAAACAGCSSEHDVEFRILTEAPPEVFLSGELIEIPEGIAVGVEAIALEDDRRVGKRVDLFPARPGIIGMDRGLGERVFVMYGVRAGSTSVDMYFNNDLVGTLTAQVIEQGE
jgi:hypothetical protein